MLCIMRSGRWHARWKRKGRWLSLCAPLLPQPAARGPGRQTDRQRNAQSKPRATMEVVWPASCFIVLAARGVLGGGFAADALCPFFVYIGELYSSCTFSVT